MNFFQKNIFKFATTQKFRKQKIFKPKDLVYNPQQAFRLLRTFNTQNGNCSVDLNITLNVDPKKNQIRGNTSLPSGVRKGKRLVVFCLENQEEEARQVGADLIGTPQTLKDISNLQFDFDVVIATNEAFLQLKPYQRILGQRRMMPNLKEGNLTTPENLIDVIKKFKLGTVSFRIDKNSSVMAPIGAINFTDEQLLTNIKAVMEAIIAQRPEKQAKGKFIIKSFLKTQKGIAFKVDPTFLDPRNPDNMLIC